MGPRPFVPLRIGRGSIAWLDSTPAEPEAGGRWDVWGQTNHGHRP